MLFMCYLEYGSDSEHAYNIHICFFFNIHIDHKWVTNSIKRAFEARRLIRRGLDKFSTSFISPVVGNLLKLLSDADTGRSVQRVQQSPAQHEACASENPALITN